MMMKNIRSVARENVKWVEIQDGKILHSTPHTGPESRPRVPRSHCRSEINIAAAAVPRKLSAASCASLENQVPARLQPLSPFMTPFPRFVYKWEEFFNSTSESTEFLHRLRLLRLCFRLYDAMSAHTLQSSVPPDAQVHRFQLTIIIIPSIQTKANMCFAFSRRFPAFFCCVRKNSLTLPCESRLLAVFSFSPFGCGRGKCFISPSDFES